QYKCFKSSSASNPKLNRHKAERDTSVCLSVFGGLVGLLHQKLEPTRILYMSLRVRIRL
ncbi:unnamed protein product, partial [Brassica rapa subsp. narinosa]